MKNPSLRTAAALQDAGLIAAEERPQLDRVLEQFSVSITTHVHEQLSQTAASNAVHAQFVPSAQELLTTESEQLDPIGDQANSPIPGIIHRYPDRLLFNLIQTCAVYCRYCFRKEKVGAGKGGLTPDQIDAGLDYIRANNNVWEVILSGGDPLTLSPRRLAHVLRELAAIEHVGIVRIHTRIPTVAPERITEEMRQALKQHPALYLVAHVNHADEISEEVSVALASLANDGIPLLSQSVLLKGVNDKAEILTALFRKLLVNRVKPYYLHHGDHARGTGHFRTSIAEGQALMQELRGNISGLCQPHYVLDIPGGHGKIPVGPNYIEQCDAGEYQLQDIHGNSHNYRDS